MGGARDNFSMKKRLRRWLISGSLAVLTGLVGSYAFLTRPAALRAYLATALEPTGLHITEGSSISFTPWTGLVVTELALSARNSQPDEPPIAHITRAQIPIHIGALITGRISLERIYAQGVVISLVAEGSGFLSDIDAASQPNGMFNGALYGQRLATLGLPVNLPPVDIIGADIQLLERVDNRLVQRRRGIVNLTGRPETDPSGLVNAYGVSLRPADAPESRSGPAWFTLRWTHADVAASTDWIDVSQIAPFLPSTFQTALQDWGICGEARLVRCAVRGAQAEELRLEIARGAASIPIEADDAGLPPSARFLQLSNLAINVELLPAGQSATAPPEEQFRIAVTGKLGSGQIQGNFTARRPKLNFEELLGASAEHPAGLDCGPWEADLHFNDIEAPTLEREPHFVKAERLPAGIRSFITDYQPRGRLSLSLRLAGDNAQQMSDDAAVRVSGLLEPRGASCRYFRFPYEVRDIHGRVSFDANGITVEELTGRHGSGLITGRGTIRDFDPWTGFNLHFNGVNMVMDRAIYEALTPSYRKLWQETNPIGLCDVHVAIARAEGSAATGSLDPTVHIETHMTNALLAVMNDTTIERTEGRVAIGDEDIRIDELHGFQEQTGVSITGTIDIPNGVDPPARNATFLATNVPVGRSSVVRHTDGDELGRVEFNGHADVWGRVSGVSGELESLYAVHVVDGRLTGFSPTAGWSAATGWILSGPRGEQILGLHAERPGGSIDLTGDLPGDVHGPPQHLRLEATDNQVETLLPQLIPPRWADVYRDLHATGTGRLALTVQPQPTDASLMAQLSVDVARMQPTALPLGLNDVHAELMINEDGYELYTVRATGDEAGVVRGHGRGSWRAEPAWNEWTIEGDGLDCTPGFVKVLPKPLATILNRTGLRGQIDVQLEPVRIVQSAAGQTWSIEGAVLLHNANLDLGLPLTLNEAEMRGQVLLTPNQDATVDGTVLITSGKFGGRSLHDVTGRLTRTRDDRWVHCSELRGALSGGEAQADVRVDPDKGDYEATLVLRNAELAEFLNRPPREGQPPTPGVVDGNLFLRGVSADRRGQRGGGRLVVRNASLLSTPVSASIVAAGQQSRRRVSAAVDNAELDLAWEGDDFQIRRVLIQSREQKLLGEGTWNQKTDQISATLYSLPPKAPAALDPLVKFFQAAGDELFQVRIEGTSNDPKARIEPLYGLTDPLRRLLSGDEHNPRRP